ncbi:MAG TPA: phosphate transport system regulatory protein PhoU [Planctomycetaceae bacterium]|nr:phosphate transport system regulatory protein PhoU [Blastopirellula sp.]HAY82628.1 phosphate transport system regulatory protein PhoU [Planctomycetaceae bacterium]
MTKHFQRDLDRLNRRVLSLSAVVEEMIDKATQALVERRADVAEQVIATDVEVDEQEVDIENDCLKLLALYQPVASDLRRIVTLVKVNNELEGIADLAVNMSERSLALQTHLAFRVPESMEQMADVAAAMVRNSMDSFVNVDMAAAHQVIASDSHIDDLNVGMIQQLTEVMKQDPNHIEPALHCFSAARHLERIGDHATNIAEDVVYLVDGEIVRHRHGSCLAGRESSQ